MSQVKLWPKTELMVYPISKPLKDLKSRLMIVLLGMAQQIIFGRLTFFFFRNFYLYFTLFIKKIHEGGNNF